MNKKMFLIFGVVGWLCAVNCYAEDTISSDVLDSAAVARVAKVGSRIKNNTATVTPVTPLTKESEDVDKVAYIYGGKKYECPWRCHWVRDDAGVLALPPKCVDANGADCTVITVNTSASAMAQVNSVDELDVEPATTGTENVININSKKLDKTSVSRAARTTKTANKAVSAAPKTPDKLGGVVLTYRCPEGCTSSNAGGSSGQTNGAFVASCVDAAGNECEVIWEVTETNTSASPARAAKVGPKVKQDSTNLKPVTSKVQDMAADGGAVAINCPAGCTPDCAILGNTVLCECKTSNGSTCKAEVVVADDTTVLK